MAAERRNPLPVGRYWVDVFDLVSTAPATKGQNEQTAFRAWLRRNAATVKVERTQSFDTEPARDFYIFKVVASTPWEGPGFPTIAPSGVQSSDDTVTKLPPEKDPLDKLGDALSVPSPSSFALILAVGLGGLVLVAKRGR